MIKNNLIIGAILSLLNALCFGHAENSSEAVFTDIYQRGVWGGQWFSGGGSKAESSLPYMNILNYYLRKCHIKSVVDIGCGDWQFSRYIDWSGINYTGYDVVKHIVDVNQKQFGSTNIIFKHGDFISNEIHGGDLLVCKEVLQHLTNSDVHYFIKNIIPKFRYCLIVDEVNAVTKSSNNPDNPRGSTRQLDLTKEPFSVKAEILLVYESEPNVFKQVLLIVNEQISN